MSSTGIEGSGTVISRFGRICSRLVAFVTLLVTAVLFAVFTTFTFDGFAYAVLNLYR
jgi:hypothetical protein